MVEQNGSKYRTNCLFEIEIALSSLAIGTNSGLFQVIDEDQSVGLYADRINFHNTGFFYPIWEKAEIDCEYSTILNIYGKFILFKVYILFRQPRNKHSFLHEIY